MVTLQPASSCCYHGNPNLKRPPSRRNEMRHTTRKQKGDRRIFRLLQSHNRITKAPVPLLLFSPHHGHVGLIRCRLSPTTQSFTLHHISLPFLSRHTPDRQNGARIIPLSGGGYKSFPQTHTKSNSHFFTFTTHKKILPLPMNE